MFCFCFVLKRAYDLWYTGDVTPGTCLEKELFGEKFSTDVIFFVMPKVYSKGHNLKKFLREGLSRTSAAAKRKSSLNV